MKHMDRWMAVYQDKLTEAVVTSPAEYVYPVTEVPRIAAKMRVAFERGSYNKDGQAIKATCKHFGIKHTYTAINQFLKQ